MFPWEAFNWGVFWAVVAAGLVLIAAWFLVTFILGAVAESYDQKEQRRTRKPSPPTKVYPVP